MAVTTFGDPALGEFVPQNDFKATQNENGGWRATQSFVFLRASLDLPAFQNAFYPRAPATELDPNLPNYWNRLKLQEVRIAHGAGTFDTLNVEYAGYSEFEFDGTTAQPIFPTYVQKGSEREVSIMEHEDVVALADQDRQIIQSIIDGENFYDFTESSVRLREVPEFAYKYQPTAGAATNWCKAATKGQVTFTEVTVTWTKTWESETGLTDAQVALLGKIATVQGSPVIPSGGTYDWRLTDYSQELTGALYHLRLEWTMSPDGGWDTLRYS